MEECDVQPEVSNFPLRYGQRRPSNASRKVKLINVTMSTNYCVFSDAHSYQTTETHLAVSTLNHCCWEEVIWRRGIFSMVGQQKWR